MTPEKLKARLTRISSPELQRFVESSLMLASTTLRNDVPDIEVNLRYGLEQAQYAVYGLEELIDRKKEGEFLRRAD